MLRYYEYILKSKFLKGSANRDISRAVKRRINDFNGLRLLFYHFRMKSERHENFKISIINLSIYHDVKTVADGNFFAHGLNLRIIQNIVNLFSYSRIMRRCDLGTVLPINLIAVVFAGVVACRDIYAGDASVISYGK